MKQSLSTRLMYSFMAIIVVIVVGVTAGISYLIADYFFKIKEHELADKGNEMAETIEYFIRMNDRDTLHRYIIAVDRLVGARIWLFNDKYELLAASYVDEKKDDGEDVLNYFFNLSSTRENNNRLQTAEGTAMLDQEIKRGKLSDKVKVILRIFMPVSLLNHRFSTHIIRNRLFW